MSLIKPSIKSIRPTSYAHLGLRKGLVFFVLRIQQQGMRYMYSREDNRDLIKGTNYTLHVTDVALSMLAKIGAG